MTKIKTCPGCNLNYEAKYPQQLRCGSKREKRGCAYLHSLKMASEHGLIRRGGFKAKTCKLCGDTIAKPSGSQMYCGSAINKTGCSYKQSLVKHLKYAATKKLPKKQSGLKKLDYKGMTYN